MFVHYICCTEMNNFRINKSNFYISIDLCKVISIFVCKGNEYVFLLKSPEPRILVSPTACLERPFFLYFSLPCLNLDPGHARATALGLVETQTKPIVILPCATRWRRRSYFGASGTRSRLSQAGLDGVLVASSRQANLFTHPVQLLPGQ